MLGNADNPGEDRIEPNRLAPEASTCNLGGTRIARNSGGFLTVGFSIAYITVRLSIGELPVSPPLHQLST